MAARTLLAAIQVVPSTAQALFVLLGAPALRLAFLGRIGLTLALVWNMVRPAT